MCGSLDPLLDGLRLPSNRFDQILDSGRRYYEASYRMADAEREFNHYYGRAHDVFAHKFFVGGRRHGKSISDDRPITQVVDEHFRQRFEGDHHASDDFQDLYDFPGAFQSRT